MSSKLKDIYSVFSHSPLQPGQNELYIDLEDVRGHGDVIRRMAQKLRLADGPTCQVLTGHRGSGKSTELSRLRQDLQEPAAGGPRYFVVQVQAVEELDLNDIDFPEVLIAIVRQVAEQLRLEAKVEVKPGFFQGLFQGVKKFLHADVSFEKLELGAGFAKLGATIRSSPEARQRVRQALEPDTDKWLTAANDVIGQAVAELEKKGYAGLVMIVDDLDKMITRPHEKAGCSTTEYLFVRRATHSPPCNATLSTRCPSNWRTPSRN